MTTATRLRYLRFALILVGLIFIFGVYPLMMALWPSGWRWSPNQAQYEQMILGVYATLGVFLLIASRNPLRHLSLIWFTVFSSVVHAGIMTVQALSMHSRLNHGPNLNKCRTTRTPLSPPSLRASRPAFTRSRNVGKHLGWFRGD